MQNATAVMRLAAAKELVGRKGLLATVEPVATFSARQLYIPAAKRGPITRLLEDERQLAFCLMLPTVVLLALFIAYPFVNGILLAVTDTRVGVPGHFVGIDNFSKIWSDDIFRVAVCNTCLYTFVTTIFKLALGLWLALLLNRHFRGKAFMRAFILLPFIIPTVLSTFAWKWMFDPTFSVFNWMLFHARHHSRADQLAWRSRPGHGVGDHRQRLARRAILRDQPVGRAADDQSRTA